MLWNHEHYYISLPKYCLTSAVIESSVIFVKFGANLSPYNKQLSKF